MVDQLQKLIKGAPRNIQEPEQPFMWLAVFPGLDSNSCMDHYFFALCWMSRQMLVHNWHFCFIIELIIRSPFRLALKATNIIKHQRCTETGTQDKMAEPFKGFYDFWGAELSYEPA